MSLLTPSESHSVQSLLAAINPGVHQAISSTQMSDLVFPELSAEDMPIPHPNGRDALQKATKDLMSLDSEKWKIGIGRQSAGLGVTTTGQYQLQQPFPFAAQFLVEQSGLASGSHGQTSALHPLQNHTQGTSDDPFALFFKPPPNTHQTPLLRLPPPLSIAPQHTVGTNSSSSSSSSTPPPPSAPSSNINPFTSQNISACRRPSVSKRTISLEHDRPSMKRQRPSPPFSTSSFSQWPDNQFHIPPNLNLPPNPLGLSARPMPMHQQPEPAPVNQRQTKATVLSPSQKKANHIQSEQKRRANIRRGYEALCDTVPSLRDTLKDDETSSANEDGSDDKGKAAGRTKKTRGKTKSLGEGQKSDGRAGPRSENIVLSKTIDYINELLSERAALLSRLAFARSILPPGHPALVPSSSCYTMVPPSKRNRHDAGNARSGSPVPILIWEREWTGGEGRSGEDGEDEDHDDMPS